MGMMNGFLFHYNPNDRNIFGNRWKQWFGEPISQDLIMNQGLHESSTPPPLVNVIRDVSGVVMSQWHQNIIYHIIMDMEF